MHVQRLGNREKLVKKTVDFFLFHLLIGLILISISFFQGGCIQTKESRESNLDRTLSEPAPSLPAPQVAPSEPQPGFEQEAPRSQNL